MDDSPADNLPVWIVEATLYKDLNRDAIHAAVADAKKQAASLLLVFALTEVPSDRESLLVGFSGS